MRFFWKAGFLSLFLFFVYNCKREEMQVDVRQAVLVELFTNKTCSNCEYAKKEISKYKNAIVVLYHLNDEYQADGCKDRYFYYNPNGNEAPPFVVIDGVYAHQGIKDISLWESEIEERGEKEEIEYEAEFLLDINKGKLRVNFVSDDTVYLKMLIVEDSVEIEGGISEYENKVVREIYPLEGFISVCGKEMISILDLNNVGNIGKSYLVLILQDSVSKEVKWCDIVRLDSVPVGYIDYDFKFVFLGDTNYFVLDSLYKLYSFDFYLQNTGMERDSYLIFLDKHLPEDWSVDICVGGLCYFDSAKVNLFPGELDTVKLSVIPVSSGSGYVYLKVKSLARCDLRDSFVLHFQTSFKK